MNLRATAQWTACTRCLHGREHGTQCTADQVRATFGRASIDTDTARGVSYGCGPNGFWHVYAAQEIAA